MKNHRETVADAGDVSGALFPVQKRFSLTSFPQAVNRLLQSLAASTELSARSSKRKPRPTPPAEDVGPSGHSMMRLLSLRFKSADLEMEVPHT